MRALLAGREIPSDVLSMGFLCSQCGVCETWACPMGLSPRYILGEFKARLFEGKVTNPYRDRPDRALDAQAWIRVPKGRLSMRLGLADVHPPPGTPIPVKAAWEVRIPLKQHVGAPAVARVRRGDRVRIGQCIGDIPQGALGARIHASMDGVVTYVDGAGVRISREA
jgi:Na+-translocating ferredoxin:NAD+ oxidoreductase RnfC subunit